MVVAGLFSAFGVLLLESAEDDCTGTLDDVDLAAGPEGLLGIADALSDDACSLALCLIGVEPWGILEAIAASLGTT